MNKVAGGDRLVESNSKWSLLSAGLQEEEPRCRQLDEDLEEVSTTRIHESESQPGKTGT